MARYGIRACVEGLAAAVEPSVTETVYLLCWWIVSGELTAQRN